MPSVVWNMEFADVSCRDWSVQLRWRLHQRVYIFGKNISSWGRRTTTAACCLSCVRVNILSAAVICDRLQDPIMCQSQVTGTLWYEQKYRILPNKHAYLNKRAPDFLLWTYLRNFWICIIFLPGIVMVFMGPHCEFHQNQTKVRIRCLPQRPDRLFGGMRYRPSAG